MRIERIDDKTVKCFVSSEEMEEFNITYKDFLQRSEKAKEIVEQIVAQAIEEVGYKPPEFALDMQIMMMPDKGMIVTLTERTPEDIQNNPILKEYLMEMKRVFEEKVKNGEIDPGNLQESLAKFLKERGAGMIAVEKGSTPSNPAQAKKEQPHIAIFAFASLHVLCEFVKVLPKNLRINSSLYVENGIYYLYLEKGAAAYKRFSKVCILAMEYATLCGATFSKLTYLQEHAECLIEEKAVQKLKL